jgi:Raf kinase inhibitor-like YbhB/YbcL family protein
MLEKIPTFVGRGIDRLRSGFDRIVALRAGIAVAPRSIVVTSSAFREAEPIPVKYTADGVGISPPIAWRGVPASARALVIVIEDADSPSPMPLVHGIAVRLAPKDGDILEGALREHGAQLAVGRNSFFSAAWLPLDPPPGHGDHRYVFQVFALDHDPDLGAHPGRSAVVDALSGHTIARGLLVGTYRRVS